MSEPDDRCDKPKRHLPHWWRPTGKRKDLWCDGKPRTAHS